jgi:hypothetical protein
VKVNKLTIDSLDEISAVDNPAQPGARAVIFKRAFSADERHAAADSGAALPDGSFPIKTVEDLKNAIHAIGRAKDRGKAIAHIKARAVALGASDLIPESFGKNTKEQDMDENKIDPAELAKVTTQLTDAQAELAIAKFLGELGDSEKAIYRSLDAAGQEGFRKLSAEQRVEKVRAAGESNPVVYTTADGETFRKNDDPRMVALAKRADADRKALADEKSARETEQLAKRAGDELGNLPGDVKVKTAVLKAVESIQDQATRDGAKALLKAGNAALAKAFRTQGTIAGNDEAPADATEAHEKLEKIAKGLRDKDAKLDEYSAYAKACELNPELHEQALGMTVGSED